MLEQGLRADWQMLPLANPPDVDPQAKHQVYITTPQPVFLLAYKSFGRIESWRSAAGHAHGRQVFQEPRMGFPAVHLRVFVHPQDRITWRWIVVEQSSGATAPHEHAAL